MVAPALDGVPAVGASMVRLVSRALAVHVSPALVLAKLSAWKQEYLNWVIFVLASPLRRLDFSCVPRLGERHHIWR